MNGTDQTASSQENLTLDQARDVVTNIADVPVDILISACLVIERHGKASERADFQAMRKVFEDPGERDDET